MTTSDINKENSIGLVSVASVDPFQARRLNRTTISEPREAEVYGLIAVGADGAFGLDGRLPWKNPTDMAWFWSLTMGCGIVSSKKTYDSIPGGLPGRSIHTTDRFYNVTDLSGWPLDPSRSKSDIFFIGGKRAIQNHYNDLDGFYVTVIPGEHKHDVSFDIEELYKKGFVLDFIGGSKTKENYCYLLAFSRGTKLQRFNHGISEHFEPYLKLTLKKSIVIEPGAHGICEINEKVYTPRDQIGIFDVRKKLGDAGLYTTSKTFKREWVGTPTITITNKSTEPMTLYKGDEIGEISFASNKTI